MKQRDYNVDLFRILATMLVIILHVLGQGGVLKATTPNSAMYWVAWFLEIMAYCAVNCFALISGYIMANKTPKLKNIVGLWFQVLFYSLVISGLCFLFAPETRSLKNLVVAFLPVLGRQWWYVSAYFALFFVIPVLNAAIHNISEKTFKKVLLVILIGICVVDCTVPKDPFVIASGYSPIWLMILYLFGAYIRKYDLKQKITASQSALAFWAVIILTFLSKFCIRFATKMLFGQVKLDNTFISFVSITIVLASVFLFLFCLNVKIRDSSKKVIGFFSPTTLSVYLIHVHPVVFVYIIKDAFVSFASKPLALMPLYILAATLVIFLLCSAIDLVRIQFFKLIKMDRLCEIIGSKITRIYQKVFRG